jgi:hypothetical protein
MPANRSLSLPITLPAMPPLSRGRNSVLADCRVAATDLVYVVARSGATSHSLIDGISARSGNLASIRQGESEVLDAVQMPGRHQGHIDRSMQCRCPASEAD